MLCRFLDASWLLLRAAALACLVIAVIYLVVAGVALTAASAMAGTVVLAGAAAIAGAVGIAFGLGAVICFVMAVVFWLMSEAVMGVMLRVCVPAGP